MPTIVPWLWFDTESEAAAHFYTSIFPNSAITDITRYGSAGPRPEGMVMTVSFTLDGQDYVALNGGPEFRFTEAISFQVTCATQTEVDTYWARLGDGGQEGQCGWLKDRYGVSWQIVPAGLRDVLGDPDPGRSARAMRAMLGMRRLDLDELRRAADEA
jgi:predicted 3-demethylubiquinone-9 3-methyltransferase (glyoxalase superfamily)